MGGALRSIGLTSCLAIIQAVFAMLKNSAVAKVRGRCRKQDQTMERSRRTAVQGSYNGAAGDSVSDTLTAANGFCGGGIESAPICN